MQSVGYLRYGIKTPQGLKIHHIKIIETDESEVILHHKSFSNHICVDLICLSFANVILTNLTGFDGVQHTLGKTQQQGIEQGCHRSVPLTQDR